MEEEVFPRNGNARKREVINKSGKPLDTRYKSERKTD